MLKFCVKILFCMNYFKQGKDPDPDRTSDKWIRIRILEAQKHADPDPQHWLQHI
jgi:hypothetical protein